MRKGVTTTAGCILLGTLLSSMAIADEIRVGGGGAAIGSLIVPVAETLEEESGIRISVRVTTPSESLVELENGLIDVATAAVSLDSMIQGAAELGVKIDPATLRHVALGKNETRVFLNKGIKVGKLSKEQLKGIFTGRITNWQEVGGANREITVVWGSKTPEQNALFTAEILDGEPVTPKSLKAHDYGDIREKVAERPGAVGIDPDGFVAPNVTVPVTPSVSSSILVVTKGESSQGVKKLIKLLTEVSDLMD